MKLLLTTPSAKEFEFFKKYCPSTINFIQTGVGSVRTIYALSQLDIEKYDIMIQLGLAGVIDDITQLGEVFMISEEQFGDLGVWEGENFFSEFDLNLENENEFPYQNGKLINDFSHPFLKKCRNEFEIRRGVTVQQISTSPKMIRHFQQMGVHLESMEGAAFHYFCLQKQIPFLQIRATSNNVGERNKSQWQMENAFAKLHSAIEVITSF